MIRDDLCMSPSYQILFRSKEFVQHDLGLRHEKMLEMSLEIVTVFASLILAGQTGEKVVEFVAKPEKYHNCLMWSGNKLHTTCS